MCLRFLRNLLKSRVIRPSDFNERESGQVLVRVISYSVQLSQVDAIMAAELTVLLCEVQTDEIKDILLAENDSVIFRTFLRIVRDLTNQVSEACLAHCL